MKSIYELYEIVKHDIRIGKRILNFKKMNETEEKGKRRIILLSQFYNFELCLYKYSYGSKSYTEIKYNNRVIRDRYYNMEFCQEFYNNNKVKIYLEKSLIEILLKPDNYYYLCNKCDPNCLHKLSFICENKE